MNYYEVLQVLPSASPEVIRMAYTALANEYHPGVYQGSKEFAEAKMQQINEAYRVLSSPESRQQYDRLLQSLDRPPQVQQPPQIQQTRQSQQTYQAAAPQPAAPAKKKSGWGAAILFLLMMVVPAMIMAMDEPEKVESTPPMVMMPLSGEILSGSEAEGGSELTVKASSTSSYVVKLKTLTGVERLSFFVRAGDTVTVRVPLEYLELYYASGDVWYGKALLFGEDTFYSKDDEVLDFTRYNYESEFTTSIGGVYDDKEIDPDDF